MRTRYLSRRIPVLCACLVMTVSAAQTGDPANWLPTPEGLRRMADYFPSESVARGPRTRELAWGEPLAEGEDAGLNLDAFHRANSTTGMIVLHRGRIVYEEYFQGADAESRFNSWSMVKSITGTLIGIAEDEGLIGSIQEPIDRYVPELAGTAYRDVTIEQVMQMSSGVQLNGTGEDIRITCLALPPGPLFADCESVRDEFGDLEGFLLSLDVRANPPGTTFRYSDADSLVLGWVIKNATGRSAAAYLSEKLWQPAGMEDDATWLLDRPGGMLLTGMALSARLRDYARFGQLILDDGMLDGERLLPEGWVARATTPNKPYLERLDPELFGYQYQWWIVPDGLIVPNGKGAFEAQGAMGQFLHIDPQHELVVAKTSVWQDLSGWNVDKVKAFHATVAAIIEALGYE